MGDEQVWNDQSRSDLREMLRTGVLGELRLANCSHDKILKHCDEVYIQDECPEQEREAFRQYAADELKRGAAQLAEEMLGWPIETDCDRLDRVEVTLRQRGIMLWQVSPCCDTCTCGEIPDRVTVVDDRFPGFRDSARGFAFFIEQNMPESLSADTELSLYLGYGWLSPDDAAESDPDLDVYEANALVIAREVCQCLREEGFEVDWNGSFSRKIGITVNWQRRSLLQ